MVMVNYVNTVYAMKIILEDESQIAKKKSVYCKKKNAWMVCFNSILSTYMSVCRNIDVKHFTSDVRFTPTWEHSYLSRSRLCIDHKLHDSSSHHTRRCHRVYLPSHQRDLHHSSYTLRTHTFLRTKRKTLYIHTALSPYYVKINFVI